MKKGQIRAKFPQKNCQNNKIPSENFIKGLCQLSPKAGPKICILLQHSKKPKNGQMAKSYFWETISKKAKFG